MLRASQKLVPFAPCRYVQLVMGRVNVLQSEAVQRESYLFCAENNVWRDGTFRCIHIEDVASRSFRRLV